VTPRKSLSNPVGLIIANHIQNTPKKNAANSDDEVEDDLESSRYDNLNKPPCLDESDDEDYYDVQEEQEEEVEEEEVEEGHVSQDDHNVAEDEQSGEEDELVSAEVVEKEEEVVEKEEKVDDLAGLVKEFKFNSPQTSPQASNQNVEKTTEIHRKPSIELKDPGTANLRAPPVESDVQTPNIQDLDTRQLSQAKSLLHKEDKLGKSSREDKENQRPNPSKSSSEGF
jgi:hypothetical protein